MVPPAGPCTRPSLFEHPTFPLESPLYMPRLKSLYHPLHFAGLTLCLWAGATDPSPAATLQLEPVKDGVLYEDASGTTANGAGEFLLAGRTNQATGSRRRSLLQFDFNALPAGALITSASLQLHLVTVTTADLAVSLHRVATPWTAGTANPTGNESSGAAALTGDNTWLHASFPGTLWTTPGGDHAATPSAAVTVSSTAGFFTWNSPGLAADVQQWLELPATNAGWILRGDEVSPQTAKRFDSADSPTADWRPRLTLTYGIIPEPSAVTLLLTTLAALFGGRRPNHRRFPSSVPSLSRPIIDESSSSG